MKTKTKQRIIVAGGLVLVIGILAGVKTNQIIGMVRAGESFVPPPLAVTSAQVQRAEWGSSRAAVGTLVAVQGVSLGAEVSGRVREIAFESGASVRRGEVLVKLDTSAEEAQLAAARARETAAAVANLRAIIAKKTIQAPFDGRIAIRRVSLGQILAPGTPIASLQTVSPIYVDFWLPQQALRDVKPGERVRLRTDTFPDAAWDGEVTTVNPEVDPNTRNVLVRGTFTNGDGRLRPGMFGNVEVLSPEQRSVLTVPATAILYAPYGDSVFTIELQKGAAGKPTSVARQKFVRLGQRRGDLVEVVSGLQAGETIVSSGAFRVRNGGAVAVNDALAPRAQLAPRPTED